ncbi:MAG: sulfatase [Planctomycetales bacterium]|nr:sulfatase [Planctomycetales bacterium]
MSSQNETRLGRISALLPCGLGTLLAFVFTLKSSLYAADTAAAAVERPPNIVLILADDLGYGGIGCYGHPQVRSPHLDRLAAEGIRFTDFHSNGAVCSPTRAALMTGRYQQRSGIEGVVTAAGHRHTGLPLDELTIAELMKQAGYATGICGKWHLGYDVKFNPTRQGFDFFRGYVSGNVDYHSHIDQANYLDWWHDAKLQNEPGYTTDLFTKYAVEFIEQHRKEPFFLYIPHEAVHYPLQGRDSPAQRALGERPGPKLAPGEDAQDIHQQMAEAMDESVGQVVATIKRLGLGENTLIFFFSDNGPMPQSSAGPLRGRKGSIYEGGHRVPAIACWPGAIKPGQTSDVQAMGADLLPTFAALAGAKLPQELTLDGRSLQSVLLASGSLAPRDLFWRVGSGRAIRRGDWKLVVTGKGKRESVELFNLADDLAEKHDLASDEPQVAKELREALRAWEASVASGVERRT